jgi:hypothetical protein
MKPSLSNRPPLMRHLGVVIAVGLVLGLGIVLPSHALDLITFAGITGPLIGALTTLSTLTPAVKAIVAVVAFVVAFIALATLRNFSPALGYVGVAIFGSVGLVVAGAIMGAVI